MTNINRRSFALAGFGAAALLGSAASPVLAASHGQSGKIPALFDATLGNYKITAIFDGIVPLQKGQYFGAEQAEIDATLTAAGIEGNGLPVPVNAYLLQSDRHTILIDAGVGDLDVLGPGLGRLSAGLAAMGVAPQDVDMIIATHAHPDHIGGLVSGGTPVFPNAELVISDVEYGFWMDSANMAQAPAEAQGMFALAQHVLNAYGDRLRPVPSASEVAPGITMELAPGHTPGHSVVHIDGGTHQLMMVADTVLSADLQTALPQVMSAFDSDPMLAAQSRARIFDRTSKDGILIAATHIHFPGFGRIVTDRDAYRFAPASWL